MDNRYEQFGWDYELRSPLSQKEIDWYAGFASMSGGPVLELACGTGRLLVELATRGFDCLGMDLSPTMLAIAEEHVSQLPDEVCSHVELRNGDMTDFEFDPKFGIAIIADNSFHELSSRAEQLSCLKAVRKHLRNGGKLLVAVRRFDPTLYENGRRQLDWSRSLSHPLTGNRVSRKGDFELAEDGKWISGSFVYKTMRDDGGESFESCNFQSPVMLTHDYCDVFSEAGFSTTAFGGYTITADDGSNSIICFVCDPHS